MNQKKISFHLSRISRCAKRHYIQRTDELEGQHEKLLKLSNDCQSEYKLLK